MTDFLSEPELRSLGFSAVGTHVQVSRRAVFIGCDHIRIGDGVRIDAFSVITAGPKEVHIGALSHVGAHTYISGAQGGVKIGYASGLAPFCALYSAVEDYTGGALTNPCVPEDFRITEVGEIELEPHVAIGSSSVVLAGKVLGWGASVGALSLVSRRIRSLEIVHGNPVRRLGYRDKELMLRADSSFREWASRQGMRLDS